MRMLVLMAGVTGTGKSTLAGALGSSLGWPVVDKDIANSSMLVVGISASVAAPLAYDLMFVYGTALLA
jgi:predicted kinase